MLMPLSRPIGAFYQDERLWPYPSDLGLWSEATALVSGLQVLGPSPIFLALEDQCCTAVGWSFLRTSLRRYDARCCTTCRVWWLDGC